MVFLLGRLVDSEVSPNLEDQKDLSSVTNDKYPSRIKEGPGHKSFINRVIFV